MKFCTNCGSQIPDEDMFCTSCGARQQDTTQHEVPPTVHDNETRCPCCGTLIVGDDMFCTNCGTRLTPAVVEDVSSQQPNAIEDANNLSVVSGKVCPRCGSSVANDEVFCTNCGVRLKDPESVVVPTEKGVREENATDSPISQADKPDAEATSEEVSTEESSKEQEEKKPKGKGTSSCIGCLFLLVLIGVLGYFVWSSGYFGSTGEEETVECDSIAECDSISDSLETSEDLLEEPEFWYDGEMEEFYGDGAFYDIRGHVKRACYTIIKDGEKTIAEKNFEVNGILKDDDTEYERDTDGRIVGLQNTISFDYDSMGLLLSETYRRANSVTEYSLNEYGYRIKWSEYHEEELVESGTYSYISFDSHGNWTECKDSKGKVTKRSFVYWAEDDIAEVLEISNEAMFPETDSSEDQDDRIYDIVEENAQFPGGDEACSKWLSEHIQYPSICQEQGVQGRVIVCFVVNCDGSISDVMIVRSPDPNLSKEAERLVSMMPEWKPACQGGKTVRSRFNLPIMFRLP